MVEFPFSALQIWNMYIPNKLSAFLKLIVNLNGLYPSWEDSDMGMAVVVAAELYSVFQWPHHGKM